jgi:hypothetical protein
MIHHRSSGMKIQLPRLQPREVDEEAPWTSSLDNARSSSLPPSSSPPQIFSSSPFASSQSSLIEIGDHDKVADRVYAPCFFFVYLLTCPRLYQWNQPIRMSSVPWTEFTQIPWKRLVIIMMILTHINNEKWFVMFLGSLITINCIDHSTSPATSPFTREAPKRTRPLTIFRKLIHCRRSDPGRKKR